MFTLQPNRLTNANIQLKYTQITVGQISNFQIKKATQNILEWPLAKNKKISRLNFASYIKWEKGWSWVSTLVCSHRITFFNTKKVTLVKLISVSWDTISSCHYTFHLSLSSIVSDCGSDLLKVVEFSVWTLWPCSGLTHRFRIKDQLHNLVRNVGEDARGLHTSVHFPCAASLCGCVKSALGRLNF